MVNDLRSILPVAQGKQGQPSAVILDGRTLQSTCESGLRAGYDGYKRKKGSKVHMAVDTPGHLPAVQVTPADEQERAQVRSLAQDVRHVTGQTVKLAFVDQGYTGQGRVAQRQDVLFEGFAEVAYTDWALRTRQRTPQTAISSPGNKKRPGRPWPSRALHRYQLLSVNVMEGDAPPAAVQLPSVRLFCSTVYPALGPRHFGALEVPSLTATFTVICEPELRYSSGW